MGCVPVVGVHPLSQSMQAAVLVVRGEETRKSVLGQKGEVLRLAGVAH